MKKKQRNQIMKWRRHKNMTIQIAELFHIFQPNLHNEEESVIQEEFIFNINSLIIPFICLMSLLEHCKFCLNSIL